MHNYESLYDNTRSKLESVIASRSINESASGKKKMKPSGTSRSEKADRTVKSADKAEDISTDIDELTDKNEEENEASLSIIKVRDTGTAGIKTPRLRREIKTIDEVTSRSKSGDFNIYTYKGYDPDNKFGKKIARIENGIRRVESDAIDRMNKPHLHNVRHKDGNTVFAVDTPEVRSAHKTANRAQKKLTRLYQMYGTKLSTSGYKTIGDTDEIDTKVHNTMEKSYHVNDNPYGYGTNIDDKTANRQQITNAVTRHYNKLAKKVEKRSKK